MNGRKRVGMPIEDGRALMTMLAGRLGVDVDALVSATATKPAWFTPGKIVQGEKPLPIASTLDLRREMSGTPIRARDFGWSVCGYTRKSDGRWTGYVLVRVRSSIETNTAAKSEAFDLVERYAATP
jgi:hypothetical protein